MSRYLNLGNAGFQSIRRGLYVDKTGRNSYLNFYRFLPVFLSGLFLLIFSLPDIFF